MYSNNDRINFSQMANILILTIIGARILTLPRNLVDKASTDGWIVLLVGGLLTAVLALAHGYIVKTFSGKTYLEILSINLTKPIAYIFSIIFIIYALSINAFLVRTFGEIVKMFLLIQTPIEVIIISILLASSYLTRAGIEPIGRLAEILLPIVLFFALFLFGLALINADFTNLLPVFQTSPAKILAGIPTVFFNFLGFEILIVFGLFLNKPQKAGKIGFYSILIILALYLILNTATLSVFGARQTSVLIWPTISVFKTIDFPGIFIENVEAVVMVIWIIIVLMSIAPMNLSKTTILSDLVRGKEQNYLALPFVPILYIVSLLPANLVEAYEYIDIVTRYMGTFIALVIPFLLILMIWIKKFNKQGGQEGA